MKFKFTTVLIVILIISSYILNANEPSTADSLISQKFDVQKYYAEINLTKALNKEISGFCSANVIWKEKTDEYFFHLMDLSVDSIFVDGIKSDFEKKNENDLALFHYRVDLPDGKNTDESEVKIYYHGSMTAEKTQMVWGGVHTDKDICFAMGVGFYNNYVSTTRHWLPCYDHPSDKAECEFKFRVNSEQVVASNGILEVKEISPLIKEYHWTHKHQIATYLMTFAVGKFDVIEWKYNETPIMIFTRPQYKTASEFAYSKVPDMIKAFEAVYGKYPFDKVGYVNAKLGAMEHQTMVTMDEKYIQNLYSGKVDANLVAAHELAHQWFGNLVSPLTFRDAWLNEGFATYSEAVWAKAYTGDYAYYLSTLKAKRTEYFADPSLLYPLVGFPRESISNYPALIYNKGALVIGMLRDYIDESGAYDFYDVIQQYLDDYKNQSITSYDLQKSLENHTGLDLNFFFNQWVYGIGYPKLDIELIGVPEEKFVKNIRIKQVQPKEWGIFEYVPIEIVFNQANNSRSVHTLYLYDEEEEFDLGQDGLYYTNYYANNCEYSCPIVQINSIKSVSNIQNENSNNFKMNYDNFNNVLSISNENYYNLGRVIISDVYGKIIYDNAILNDNELSFDMNNFSNGMYAVKIINGNSIKNSKYIKIN